MTTLEMMRWKFDRAQECAELVRRSRPHEPYYLTLTLDEARAVLRELETTAPKSAKEAA